MGSVAIEDVGADISRYPYAGMSDDIHDRERARAERRRNPSNQRHNQQSTNYPYSSVHHPSVAAPQLNTQNVSSNYGNSPSQQSQRTTSSRALESALPAARAIVGNADAVGAHSNDSTAARSKRHDEEDTYSGSDVNMTEDSEAPVASPPSPQLLPTVRSSLQLSQSSAGSPTRIKIKSLSHIHSFASEDALTRSQHGARSLDLKKPGGPQYEISEMPVTDIIEMVAGLLTRITTQNDRQSQHENINRHIPAPEGKSAVSQQAASVLSFHGKNVPSITILSYLSRIHKYCPTTYEVFLSLLVYFDRMTSTISKETLTSFKSAAKSAEREILSPGSTTSLQAEMLDAQTKTRASQAWTRSAPSNAPGSDSEEDSDKLPNHFVIDSFNIHRLVIAGVACASKFFSDIFYTNSRYAKVTTRSWLGKQHY